jgi:hypothetical protein
VLPALVLPAPAPTRKDAGSESPGVLEPVRQNANVE